MSNVPGIELIGLTKHYGGHEALRGVDLIVPAGQVCGYLGRNGAGKSTTMKLIAGTLAASSGVARVAGHDVASAALEAKRALGYLPETGALYSLLSPREHLALLADLYELDRDHAGERIELLAAMLDLSSLLDRRIDTLSKGQRQRAAIATALLHEPQVILLDEPLNGLDAHAAGMFRDIVTDLAHRGCTVLYCSHMLDVVERVCSRAVILDQGQVVADAPMAELLQRAGTGATLDSIFRALTQGSDRDAAC